MSKELQPGQPDWTPPTSQDRELSRRKGLQMKQTGIVVCGSAVAVFLPALVMLQRRGVAPIVFYILFGCWFFDLAFGLWFIVRGNKLIQQGSERNG